MSETSTRPSPLGLPAWQMPSLSTILFWILLLGMAGFYWAQILSYGPTSDPDPDGYVTYANHLRDTGTLLEFRRLPGYPLFIVLADALSPEPIAVDVLHVQVVLSVAILLTLSILVERHFGKFPALLFAMIVAVQSYFGFISAIMLADFLSALVGHVILLTGILFFLASGWRRAVVLLAFGIAVYVGVAVHSGLLWITLSMVIALVLMWLADRVLPWKFASERFRKWGLPGSGALAATGLVAYALVQVTLVPPHPGRKPSFERFYEGYAIYYMTMCLPPARAQGDPVDADVQKTKAEVSEDLGYPAERSRHPHLRFEIWGRLQVKRPEVDTAYWRERAIKSPLSFVGCAYNEIQSRYHDLVRNMYPFLSDRNLVNYFRPPFDTRLANKTYWATGIYAKDMSDEKGVLENAMAFGGEFFRVISFIAMLGGGTLLFGRRYPELAGALLLGSLGWMAAVSSMLPLDARYLVVVMPFVYLCEALSIAWVAQMAFKAIRMGLAKVLPKGASKPQEG